MGIQIGIVLALFTWGLGRWAAFDRDRAFYPTVLITIATYDVLFAVMGGTSTALVIESVFATLMVAISAIGLRVSPWIIVGGFALHGVADGIHDAFSPDAGIPAWWPGFCAAYDLAIAALLAMRLARGRAHLDATRRITPPDPTGLPMPLPSLPHALVAATLGGTLLLAASIPAIACPQPPEHAGGTVNARTRFLERNLRPAIMEVGAAPMRLEDRMQAYGVPGVSVAVIHRGRVHWARGWGVRDMAGCQPVTPDTAFQAASISKLVTAVMTLRMVERGELALDDDINTTLRTWHLPDAGAVAQSPVTMRGLLSHTAGLNVHGFPGYAADASLPTAVQVLSGSRPANTEAVRVLDPPGSAWRYSGGGYVMAQVALEDSSRLPFTQLADDEVFERVGMRHSAFAQPPTGRMRDNFALGHVDGRVIAGGYHVYPELGPAGLWTTAGDLALLLLDLQASANGRPAKLLSPAMTATMLAPVKGNWGLGPALYGTGPGRRFGHDGVNAGFEATMVAYVERGEGVIVLTNGPGKRLADEIVRAVAADYGWTELMQAPVLEVAVAPARLASLAGRYDGGSLSVHLDLRDGHLYAQTGGPEPERLVAISDTRFRTSVSAIGVEFDLSPGGTPVAMRIIEGAPPMTLTRVAAPTTGAPAVPLFLRGSMNGWGTTAPLEQDANGTMVVDMTLDAGEHRVKIASDDWQSADYGVVGASAVREPFGVLRLVPRGGNLRIVVDAAGTFRFTVRTTGDSPELQITRLGMR